MAENQHFEIFLSADWDGRKGIVTVRPPLPRAIVFATKNALRDELPLMRDPDDSSWMGVSAIQETRFMKAGVQSDALKIAGAIVHEVMKQDALDVSFDAQQVVVRTEEGFYPVHAA